MTSKFARKIPDKGEHHRETALEGAAYPVKEIAGVRIDESIGKSLQTTEKSSSDRTLQSQKNALGDLSSTDTRSAWE